MRQVAQVEIVNTAQFLDDGNGRIIQAIPLNADQFFVSRVQEFKELEYSLEGPVPFSGDPRLAFNSIPEAVSNISPEGFRLIGKEFNRMARLSGTNDPEIVKTMRSKLIKCTELVTFLVPVYRDAGHVITKDSLKAFPLARHVPAQTCYAIIEVKCRRDYDYMPSRSTLFFFYYRDWLRIVEHTVHVGPQHDCPGEEWAANAYEGSYENKINRFFEHHDGAVSIEMQTQPRGLIRSAGFNFHLYNGILMNVVARFSPVLIHGRFPPLAFSPPEVPDRKDTSHLSEFKQCLEFLHGTIRSAVSRQNRYWRVDR